MKPTRLVLIPTYNEAGNVAAMHRRLTALGLEADILFIDDNSPDGTGAILDSIAAGDSGVHVIHRPGKLGIGSAHLEGIRWAYEHNYQVLMSLDCDFTHRPEYLPVFLEQMKDADFLISSRYLTPDSLAGWTVYRRFLTRCGNLLTRHLLDMPYDATTSFRLYRLDRISPALFDHLVSRGYAFFFESTYVLHKSNLKIKQIAVDLPVREAGTSKMGISEILASLSQFGRLLLLKRRLTIPADIHSHTVSSRTGSSPISLPTAAARKGAAN